MLLDLSAREMALAVRSRRMSAASLIDAALDRARALAPCNCFCYLLEDDARQAARRIDRALERGESDLPLLGLSLPAGNSAGDLPVGLQMVGRRYGDEALLGLAGSVESLLAS